MAIAAIVPVVWGVMTDQLGRASWIAIAAECICWVELKGSFAQRLRILVGGAVLALLFGLLGSITGASIWLSVLAMLLVGFVAGLFKNLGDRASGLAICVQVMFVLSNAFPVGEWEALQERLLLIGIGGGWTIFAGVVAAAFLPAQQPYRRSIALIWRANGALVEAVARGWDRKTARSSVRELYEKEKDIRLALDNSFHFFEQMAHQQDKTENEMYQLAQLRKATALVASHITAIGEEMEQVRIHEVDPEFRIKLYDTLRAFQQAAERLGVFVVNLKPEERLLIDSRISRLNNFIALLKQHKTYGEYLQEATVQRIIHLLERSIKLMHAALSRLEDMGEDLPVFRSYSLVKTMLVLHPRHWLRSIRLLLNMSTSNARYAIRSAVAAAIGLLAYKWLDINHGYWIAFTSLLVIQPFFTATVKKAVDRVLGTLAGGVVGGLLIQLPTGIYAKELMLFISSIFMVYFIKTRYSVAVFFVTLSVVLLFDVEDAADPTLIISRALCTTAGAVLGITAGFALLTNWDRYQLPKYLSQALLCNSIYFRATFLTTSTVTWTKLKRNAETKNSNAFDSFSRYMQEPLPGNRKYMMAYYQLVNHNVRITRELNNIHLEAENNTEVSATADSTFQRKLILDCAEWFNKALQRMSALQKSETPDLLILDDNYAVPFTLSPHQTVYLEKLLIELKALHKVIEHINEK